MTKHKLTLRPELKTVEIEEGENLLNALRLEDVYIKSSCGGVASCSDCIIKIFSGEEHLNPIEFAELKLLGNVYHITKERLACQTKITGNVTIDISRHDKGIDQEKLKKKTSSMRPKTKSTLRKKAMVEQIRDEREQNFKEKESGNAVADQPWFKHWEKTDQSTAPTSRHQKKLGGGKRPRPFKFESEDE